MTELELKDRTTAFGLRGLKLVDTLPESRSGRVIADELTAIMVVSRKTLTARKLKS